MNDNVRPPDMPKTEQLISHQPSIYAGVDEQEQIQWLNQALVDSEMEYEFQQTIALSSLLQKQREERSKHFASAKSKFIQFMRIDKSQVAFYSDLIRYIEKYEIGDLESVSVGEEFYIRFRRTLDNIRINANEKSRLLDLIRG